MTALERLVADMKDILRRIRRLESQEVPRYVPLTTRLTSTSWDGDSYSTTAKTLIDLSAVFSVPAFVKAIDVGVSIRDSASAAATSTCYLILAPVNTNLIGRYIYCAGLANDAWTHGGFIVPCDSNGDVYVQINASGASTLDVYIEIHGYWI